MQLRTLFSFTVVLCLLAACTKATTTSISQSYRNPGYEQTVFKRLFVIAVAQNQDSRKAFEDAFANAINGQGGSAEASWGHLPKSEQLTEDEIRDAVEAGGFDGVLITRLLAVDKEQQYTPASTYNNPRTRYYAGGGGLYGYGFYGFYGTTYAKVHEPGYFETSTTIRVETNLYSLATDALVWTGQSATVDPTSIADARESMTAAVAEKLKEEKLIP